MKRKYISIVLLTLFGVFSIKPINVSADMGIINGMGSDMMQDFSMDMIMQQGQMSIDGSSDMMEYAEGTNFMNHQNDDTLTFFFDNLDQYNIPESIEFTDEVNNSVRDAFDNGEWSNAFNEQFNMDSGLLFPEVNFVDEVHVDSPQSGIDNSDITNSPSMPEPLDDNNDSKFPEDTGLPDHSDVVDQINNNTLPDEMPENPSNNNDLSDNNDNLNYSKDDDLNNNLPDNSNDILSGGDEPPQHTPPLKDMDDF